MEEAIAASWHAVALTWLGAESVVNKFGWTLLVLALLWGLHQLVRVYIRRAVTRPLPRQRYWAYSRNLHLLLGLALVVAVWAEELATAALLLTGLVAAALIAGKEVALGLAGRMGLAAAEHYRLGDRILINGICGEVIDIGLLYTWLLEVQREAAEMQSTGRIVLVPHLWITQHAVINSTRGHDHVWDELYLPLEPGSDTSAAAALVQRTAETELAAEVAEARRQVPTMQREFAAQSPPVEPVCYVSVERDVTGKALVVVRLRYAVAVRSRRPVHSRLTLAVLHALEQAGFALHGQEIASTAAGAAEGESQAPR